MHYLRAVIAVFRKQWKTITGEWVSISFFIGVIPTAAVIAWIVRQSGNSIVITYLMIGASIMAIWRSTVLRVGWSLGNELASGTLDFTLISRTSIMWVLLGKALAEAMYGIPAAVISFITVLLVAGEFPVAAEIGYLLPSLLFVVLSLTITSLLFSPLVVVMGGRGGFFNAIIPFGIVLSGFFFPVERLPFGLQIVARIIPTSWAMDSIWLSICGFDSWWLVLRSWGMCILASAWMLGITYLILKIVEKRLRVSGTLTTY